MLSVFWRFIIYSLYSIFIIWIDIGVVVLVRYVSVGDIEFFYYFVESQGNPGADPLILYMNGGPGCSGLNGFFYQVGMPRFPLLLLVELYYIVDFLATIPNEEIREKQKKTEIRQIASDIDDAKLRFFM